MLDGRRRKIHDGDVGSCKGKIGMAVTLFVVSKHIRKDFSYYCCFAAA